MTTRERCMSILHYRSVDRLPAVHFGYWGEVLDEWAEQGHITREMAQGARGDGSAVQRELDRIMPGSKFALVQYYAEEIKKIRI